MRRTIHAAAAALMAWSAGGTLAAKAADLSMPPVYEPEASPIVELGSGWYLRADANAYESSFNTNHFGTLTNTNFGATIGAGYQFNQWFRVDATFDYMTPVQKTQMVVLQGTGMGVSIPSSSAFGSLTPPGCPVAVDPANPGNIYTLTCTANPWFKITANAYLMNGYLDLGHWYGLTPYIGAGAGLAYIHEQGNVTYRFINGALYGDGNSFCGGSTGIAGVPCFHLGYPNNAGINITNYNFAFALMAGFSYDISSLLKLDFGYRYLNLGSNLSSQEFRAGIRITPDG
jgi:opacity protein-like surface antigen